MKNFVDKTNIVPWVRAFQIYIIRVVYMSYNILYFTHKKATSYEVAAFVIVQLLFIRW